MKRWLMLQILLSMIGMSQAMDKSSKPLVKEHLVKLPSAQVLMQRLQEAGFSDFLEKTKIIEKLGEQLKSPWRVFLAVELALFQAYEQNFSDYKKAMKMQGEKLNITHLILQDFPEAIERLAQTGIVLNTCEEDNSYFKTT